MAVLPTDGVMTARLPPSDLAEINLMVLLVKPPGETGSSLLLLACLGMVVYVISLVRGYLRGQLALRLSFSRPAVADLPPAVSGPPSADSMARRFRNDDSFSEHSPLILGLLAGAIWPWVSLTYPVLGAFLAVVMAAGILASTLSGRRIGGQISQSRAMGFFAGWVTLSVCAAVAGMLEQMLHLNPMLAIALALISCALLGVSMQLRLGRPMSYGLAIIAGMITMTMATLSADAAIATVAALCIAIVALALVRVAT